MKVKIFALAGLFLISVSTYGQNFQWKKNKKQEVYTKCLDDLKWKSLSDKQRKDICVCYIEEIQKSYSQEEFVNLLEVEITRFKKSTMCWPDPEMLNPGHTTNYPGNPRRDYSRIGVVMPNLTKEKLVGIWKFPHSIIFLNEDGTYFVNYTDPNTNDYKGNWSVGTDKRSINLTQSNPIVVSEFQDMRFTYQAQEGQWDTATRIVKNLGNMVNNDLLGSWQDENSSIYFDENKECSILMDDGKKYSLKWRLDSNTKQIIFSTGYAPMKILEFDGLSFRYEESGRIYRYVRKFN